MYFDRDEFAVGAHVDLLFKFAGLLEVRPTRRAVQIEQRLNFTVADVLDHVLREEAVGDFLHHEQMLIRVRGREEDLAGVDFHQNTTDAPHVAAEVPLDVFSSATATEDHFWRAELACVDSVCVELFLQNSVAVVDDFYMLTLRDVEFLLPELELPQPAWQ